MAQFRNASRALHIVGTAFVYLSEGAYGVVFVDRHRKRIRKIARRRPDENPDHCREVFEAEIDAYKIASESDELRPFVPTFFGACSGNQIADGNKNDVSAEFYSDLAFEAEFIDCDFVKNAKETPEIARLAEVFRKHRINHLVDISVCFENGRIRKVIDFAVEEHVLSWD